MTICRQYTAAILWAVMSDDADVVPGVFSFHKAFLPRYAVAPR